MSRINLVGVFDEYDQAMRARQKIEAAGIDRQSIKVTAGQATMPGAEVDSSGHRPGAIRRFFAEVFGTRDTDEQVGHYSEAVRRGSTVVSVHAVDERHVDEICRILVDCGAIDIDQRLEQWRAGGYTGHDENAPPYTREQIAEERNRNVLPIAGKELHAGRRRVQRGGVRVHRRVVDEPIEVAPGRGRVVADPWPFASQRTGALRDDLRWTTIDVEPLDRAPQRQHGLDDGAFDVAALRRYSGPERRVGADGAYAGVERRDRDPLTRSAAPNA